MNKTTKDEKISKLFGLYFPSNTSGGMNPHVPTY